MEHRLPYLGSANRNLQGSSPQNTTGYRMNTVATVQPHSVTSSVTTLREAMLRLAPEDRTVLTLYYFEQLKPMQIAAILGLSESLREFALRLWRQTVSSRWR